MPRAIIEEPHVRLFALANQLEARLFAAQRKVDTLTPSLLTGAFSAQLVPQDPDDEPAEKWLERSKAARNGSPSHIQAGKVDHLRRNERPTRPNQQTDLKYEQTFNQQV